MSKLDDVALNAAQDTIQALLNRAEAAEAAAARLRSAATIWQPIDTAPKVANVEILIFSKDGIDIAVWGGRQWVARGTRGEEYFDIDTPTHWMPLPPFPT